jgi:Reverse transcriptase (RNA-dependent DNA polymerase).
MDDIIVPGTDEEEAYVNLETVLKTSADNGLCINWRKCSFLKRRVEFLGHTIEAGRVRPSQEKIKAVRLFPEPRTREQLQRFLGLTGYFRKFVKDYARIAHPLSELLKKGVEFVFSLDQKQAFTFLKDALSREPVLAIYDPQSDTEVHTDASKEGYGAIMLQRGRNGSEFHPVHYFSRKTSEAERKYHSYELEMLAAVKAIQNSECIFLESSLSWSQIALHSNRRCRRGTSHRGLHGGH